MLFLNSQTFLLPKILFLTNIWQTIVFNNAGIEAVKFVYEIKERHFILFIIKCLSFWEKGFFAVKA